MKIALIDMIYPKGHKRLNYEIAKILSEFSNVVVLDKNGYYDELKESTNLKKIEPKIKMKLKDKKLLKQLIHCVNLVGIKLTLVKEKPDKVIILTHHNITFSIMQFLFKHQDVFIMHHNSIDNIKGRINSFLFSKYMNNVKHIVFAEFIKEGLIRKTNVLKNNVCVVNHPLIFKHSDKKLENEKCPAIKTFISLGLDSDEKIIEELINIDKKQNIFSKNNIKLILRSSWQEHESPGLKVFKGFLSEKDYNQMYNEADVYLLLYPDTYENRFGGSFLNAFAMGKSIAGTSVPFVKYIVSKYPKSCVIVNDTEDLVYKLINYNFIFDKGEYNSFLTSYSNQSIKMQFINCLRMNNGE